jgi:hypothetical protein
VKQEEVRDAELEKSRRLKRRWQLMILLAKHPNLQKLRKHTLKREREAELDSEQEEDPIEHRSSYGSISL